MLCEAGSVHPGGSLSSIDIMNILYNKVMKHDHKDPHWEGRDRFVLSNGHVTPALYSVPGRLCYFLKEDLATLRKHGSLLQGQFTL